MTKEQLIANNRKSLLIFAERQGISKACRLFGVSRTTYYKIKKQYVETGSLEPVVRRKPKMPNETSFSKKKKLLKLIKQYPSWGLDRYAYEFHKEGIGVSRAGIYYTLKRFDLNRKFKRLIYIETLNKENQPVTEKAIRQLRQRYNNMVHGQWPGHVTALDTFYVGNLKGVGRIYQITGIDLCSRYGWANLYVNKDQESTMDFVETVFMPKMYRNNVAIESVLTDNGSEFTGSKFRQMLIDYDIRHHRIAPGKPVLNGYCERFQRTIYEEFYQVEFRRRFFKTLEQLQEALNRYLVYYNFERPHFGVVKTGAVPIDILKSKEHILRHCFQKLLT
jgi:transposase InsO family protein